MSLRNRELGGNGYCENTAVLKGVKEVFRYCLHFFIGVGKKSAQTMSKNHSVIVSFMQIGAVKPVLHLGAIRCSLG